MRLVKVGALSVERRDFIRNGLARENDGEHHFSSKQRNTGF
jgi:hypothetical protein